MKNTLKFTILIILAWAILPTADFSDVLIIPFLINILGFELYILLAAIFMIYLYKTIEGKTIFNKFDNIKKEIRRIVKF